MYPLVFGLLESQSHARYNVHVWHWPANEQAADLIFQIKLNNLHIIALQCVDLIMLTNLFHIYAT